MLKERSIIAKQVKSANKGEKKARMLMDRYGGHDRLDSVVVGDRKKYKEMAEIDNIIHGDNCLIAIEIKSWNGKIETTLDPSGETWTVTSNSGEITKRRSPLVQAQRHAEIINLKWPGIRVIPIVMVMGWNEFDAVPEGVILYQSAKKLVELIHSKQEGDDPQKTEEVWNEIVDEEYSDWSEQRAKKYMRYVIRRHKAHPEWINALISTACFILVASMVLWLSFH